MIPRHYLAGVSVTPFEGCSGVFVVEDYRSPSAWRYVATYADGKRQKARIFALLRVHGQPEDPARWDLHHIVEGQHFADVDFAGRLRTAYQQELPCVLIHKDEHVAYNQLLHIKATDELFRGALPREMEERARLAATRARDPLMHGRLRQDVQRLRDLYRLAYQGDPALQQIADNVLKSTLNDLRA